MQNDSPAGCRSMCCASNQQERLPLFLHTCHVHVALRGLFVILYKLLFHTAVLTHRASVQNLISSLRCDDVPNPAS